MQLENLIPILIAFFIVTVSPGPANIAVAAVSMSSGRKNGAVFGLGLATGLAFWGIIAATGLGVILQASELGLLLLKLFGGVYLLWLAFQSARSASRKIETIDKPHHKGSWFLRGLILNLSNPKAVLAWMTTLSMGLGTGENLIQLTIATAICMMIGVANYVGHAFVFSVSTMMTAYGKARRRIDGVVAGLFALAGLSLIRSAFVR